jgi:hypothetical protein
MGARKRNPEQSEEISGPAEAWAVEISVMLSVARAEPRDAREVEAS